MRRALAIIATLCIVVLALSYGAASAVVWHRLTSVDGECHPEWTTNDPTSFSKPGVDVDTTVLAMPAPEDVTFASRESGITVSGWWIPAGDGAPAVIVVHGHTACKRDPDVLLPAGMLYRHGYSILLIDLRDHGDSTDEDGRYAGGTEEFRDVLGAWDWLQVERSIPGGRIGLVGISLGAATTVIAAGEEPAVVATWADSSYADIVQAIRAELSRNHYPEWLWFGGVTIARLVSGDDLTSRSPFRAVLAMTDRKLFITHGTQDARLSVTYAQDLIGAARDAHVDASSWLVEGAGHTEAMWLRPNAYEEHLVAFFEDAVGH